MEIARTGELVEIQVQDLCWLVEIVSTFTGEGISEVEGLMCRNG